MKGGAPRRRGRADVLIAGGGTAGHVLPALTVARALVDGGVAKDAIAFVGSQRGMEATFVPRAGFVVTLLPGRGIVRRLSLSNIRSVLGLIGAAGMSLRLMITARPAVIVTVGGYASVPPALAGFICRVPIVVVNIDAVPGLANRVVARVAKKSAVAFPGTKLPHAVLTGAPVRDEVLGITPEQRPALRAQFNIEAGKTLIVVIGGSLGAQRLNDAAIGLYRRYVGHENIVIYHVAGERDVARVQDMQRNAAVRDAKIDYRIVPYEASLPALFGAADLVISRAGASTIAELAVIGAPSILIPLPNAPGDHQRVNAEVLERVGAAVIVSDSDATAEILGSTVDDLIGDEARLAAMRAAGQTIAQRNAARQIAQLISDVAGKRVSQAFGHNGERMEA